MSALALGSDYTQLSRWNPSTEEYEHYVGNPTYDQFDTFEVGKGYQIYVNNPAGATLTITAPPAANPASHTLETGKNLVGHTGPGALTVSALLTGLAQGVDYQTVKRYNGTGYDALSQTDTVQPGEALWVDALQQVAWTPPAPTTTTQFIYDGDGGRVKQSVDGQGTLYLGDLVEIAADGTRTEYVYAGDQRIAQVTDDGAAQTARWIHGDHLGSASVLTDETGAIASRLEYTPFGQVATSVGDTPEHTYTGQRSDSSTGLMYYRARYYDPELGRFITPDTFVQSPADPQTLNRYSYVRNNPVKYVDPSGHFFNFIVQAIGTIIIHAAIGAAVGAVAGGIASKAQGGSFSDGLKAGLQWGAATGALAGALGFLPGFPHDTVSPTILAGQAGGVVGAGVGARASESHSPPGLTATADLFVQGWQNWKAGRGFVTNRMAAVQQYEQELERIRALSINQTDTTVMGVSRPLTGREGSLSNPLGPHHNAIVSDRLSRGVWEMGPKYRGGPIVTSNTVPDLSEWRTHASTQKALDLGGEYAKLFSVNVNAKGLRKAIELYEATFVGQEYLAYDHNSNYAVNSVLYGAGADKRIGYRAPGFPDGP